MGKHSYNLDSAVTVQDLLRRAVIAGDSLRATWPDADEDDSRERISGSLLPTRPDRSPPAAVLDRCA
jgi:hypothetical protein